MIGQPGLMHIPLSSFLCNLSHPASEQLCCLLGCENNFGNAKPSEIVSRFPKLWDGEKLKVDSSTSGLNKN